MQIKTSTQNGVAIVEPAGTIDTRASLLFERQILDLLEGGSRQFAIDLAKVDLITSAGIRVLVMLAQRLHGVGGGLVLYALGDQVRTVFDIAGLMRQFRVAASREEALKQLASDSSGRPSASVASSKVSRLAKRLLASEVDTAPPMNLARPATDGHAKSQLSVRVATLLRERKG